MRPLDTETDEAHRWLPLTPLRTLSCHKYLDNDAAGYVLQKHSSLRIDAERTASVECGLAKRICDPMQSLGIRMVEGLLCTVGPSDRDSIDRSHFAQAKVGDRLHCKG